MSARGNVIGGLAYYAHIRGDYEKAKILYQRAMELGLDNPKRVASYGVIALREGQFKIAIDIFTKALRLHPKPKERASIRISRAIAYLKIGEIESARVALEDIHAKHPSAKTYQSLGYFYIVTDDEKALEFNEEAINYQDNDPVILDNVGQYYLIKGHPEVARQFFEEAFEIIKTKADINYHLAEVELDVKNYDKAFEYAIRAKNSTISALNDVTIENVDKMIEELKQKVSDPDVIIAAIEEKKDAKDSNKAKHVNVDVDELP